MSSSIGNVPPARVLLSIRPRWPSVNVQVRRAYSVDHLALREAEGFGQADSPEALAGAPGEDPGRPPQEGALATARKQRHRDPRGAQGDVREGARGLGLRGDDEPRRAQTRLDLQKRSMASSERDERGRRSFREYVRRIAAERSVFVDERSTNIALSPIYARVPKGERAYGKAPRNWGKNVSLICAIDSKGVKPSMSLEGAVDAGAFEAYVERFLVPHLRRGQIVVMDNLSVRLHRLPNHAPPTRWPAHPGPSRRAA